ncbi:hypothetical protein ABK040_001477 [Willaertia magna]
MRVINSTSENSSRRSEAFDYSDISTDTSTNNNKINNNNNQKQILSKRRTRKLSPGGESPLSSSLNLLSSTVNNQFNNVDCLFEKVKENAQIINVKEQKRELANILENNKLFLNVTIKNNENLFGQHLLLENLEKKRNERLIIKKESWKDFQLNQIQNIYSQFESTFIVMEDESIWCAGNNSNFQLGLGHSLPLEEIPTKLEFTFDSKVKKICCLKQTTVFLTESGKVYVCGLDIFRYENNHFISITNITNGILDITHTEDIIFFLTKEGTICVSGNSHKINLLFTNYLTEITTLNNPIVYYEEEYHLRLITSLFSKDIKKITCNETQDFFILFCMSKDNQSVYCIGDNSNGQFGIGCSKNFNCFKELTYFKENNIDLKDVKIAKYGECYFLTKDGKVYRTGGSNEFYYPKQILHEHTIETMEAEGIFKNTYDRYIYSYGDTKALAVYKYFNERFQLVQNCFIHFNNNTKQLITNNNQQDLNNNNNNNYGLDNNNNEINSSMNNVDVFIEIVSIENPFEEEQEEINNNNKKNNEQEQTIVIIPKSFLFGCKLYFDRTNELIANQISGHSGGFNDNNRKSVTFTTFFNSKSNLLFPIILTSTFNYVELLNDLVTFESFKKFINSQPVERLLIGEFSYKSAVNSLNEIELQNITTYFGISQFKRHIDLKIIMTNYEKEVKQLEPLKYKHNFFYKSLSKFYWAIKEGNNDIEDKEDYLYKYFTSINTTIISLAFEYNFTIFLTHLYYFIGEEYKNLGTNNNDDFNMIINIIPNSFEELKQFILYFLGLNDWHDFKSKPFKLSSSNYYITKSENIFFLIICSLLIKIISKYEIITKRVCELDIEDHVLFTSILKSYHESIIKLSQQEKLNLKKEKQIITIITNQMLLFTSNLLKELHDIKSLSQNIGILIMKYIFLNVLEEDSKWLPPNIQIFGDNYIVLKRIGGGMEGVVYKAYDRLTHTIVALKRTTEVLDKEKLKDVSKQLDFLMNLKPHKNLVPILKKFVERKGEMYSDYGINIVMPFKGYGTLCDYIIQQQHKSFVKEWLQFSLDIVYGLEQLHYQNLIYRDLKSENILLDKDEEDNYFCAISDFGLITKWDARSTVSIKGTPITLAPELYENNSRIDKSCDLFSLGCVMFELLTLQRVLIIKKFNQLTNKEEEITFLMHEAIRNDELQAHTIICDILQKNGFSHYIQRLIISLIQKRSFFRPQAYQIIRILESFRDYGLFTLDTQLDSLLLPLPNSVNIVKNLLVKERKKRNATNLNNVFNERYKIVKKIMMLNNNSSESSSTTSVYLCNDNNVQVMLISFKDFQLFCNFITKYSFSHKNIIKIIDTFKDDKYFYIVTDFLSENTLFTTLQKDQLNEENIKTIILQLCNTLQFIHERKKLLLNLTLQSIQINQENSQILITNLDNCIDICLIDNLNNNLPFIPEYHSRHNNKELSFKSDIFNLGLIWYQLITKQQNVSFDMKEFDCLSLMKEKLQQFNNASLMNEFILKILDWNPMNRPSLERIEQFIINGK